MCCTDSESDAERTGNGGGFDESAEAADFNDARDGFRGGNGGGLTRTVGVGVIALAAGDPARGVGGMTGIFASAAAVGEGGESGARRG